MAFKKDDRLYHVGSSGNISVVTASANEANGSVPIRYSDGREAEIGTFHLFSSETAANRAALNRSRKSVPSSGTTFVTKPR